MRRVRRDRLPQHALGLRVAVLEQVGIPEVVQNVRVVPANIEDGEVVSLG
ncbi:MAG TPA: hypothetical protein VF170_16370 [Planctomycetaceae bacterium]